MDDLEKELLETFWEDLRGTRRKDQVASIGHEIFLRHLANNDVVDGSWQKWQIFRTVINSHFHGYKCGQYLGIRLRFRQSIVCFLQSSTPFTQFSNSSIFLILERVAANLGLRDRGFTFYGPQFQHPEHLDLYRELPIFPERILYTIDMKKANFNCLRLFSPEIFGGQSNWEDFVRNTVKPPDADPRYRLGIFLQSKQMRSEVFGHLQHEKITDVERYLVYALFNFIQASRRREEWPGLVNIFFFPKDELVIELCDPRFVGITTNKIREVFDWVGEKRESFKSVFSPEPISLITIKKPDLASGGGAINTTPRFPVAEISGGHRDVVFIRYPLDPTTGETLPWDVAQGKMEIKNCMIGDKRAAFERMKAARTSDFVA